MTKTPLAEVIEDHRNMALLLELLRSDVGELRDGGEIFDIERLRDIIDYFAHCPDRVHYAREETMFSVFRGHPIELRPSWPMRSSRCMPSTNGFLNSPPH